ncbi:MAG: hypothetical protein M0Z42_20870 [Actinomycetota bacterium]|jgi:predicted enzyme related to lactoylglutathione lyase|nr:hypothetical protein [Actinomycetota bacterium]
MLHLAQAEPGRRTTGAELGFTVGDVDVIHQKAAAFDVTVLRAPHQGEWGRSAHYQDPDGNVVSLTNE